MLGSIYTLTVTLGVGIIAHAILTSEYTESCSQTTPSTPFTGAEAPTYSAPLMSLHKVGLESSSTKSSFPTDSAKPIPLAENWLSVFVSRQNAKGIWHCTLVISDLDILLHKFNFVFWSGGAWERGYNSIVLSMCADGSCVSLKS